MTNNRFEKIVATMVSDRNDTKSKIFGANINGIDHILDLIERDNMGGCVLKSRKDNSIHKFISIPPFYRKYCTNNNIYIFKTEE